MKRNGASQNVLSLIQVNREPGPNVTEVKLVAPLNTSEPMLLTLAGMVMEVKLDAFRNALSPILVNCEFGANVNEVKLYAFRNAYEPMLVN